MSTRAIEFATIDLCDALDIACLIEEEAQDRYVELVEQMELHHNPDVAQFFRFMQSAEAKHERALKERRAALFGYEPTRISRRMLFDVEAPDYDEVRAAMSVREAFETALSAERKAFAFFDRALAALGDPRARTLFEELREEELRHQELLLAELARRGPEPVPEVALIEDDPVPL